MKRFIPLFIVFSYIIDVHGQGSISFEDKDFIHSTPRDIRIDSILFLQPAYKNMGAEEKEVVYWINYVRMYPEKFNAEILLPFLAQFPEVKSSYSQSLTRELSTTTPLNILLPNDKLNKVAAKHSSDLGSTGSSISHNSSRGTSFQERMNQAGLKNCVAENIYEGKQEALKSVIFLLIDNGVKSLGHRKNILSGANRYIGVSFYPIKNRRSLYFLVQNFSCE